MNLEKLKDTARKHEQREDWRKAIDVYQRAIQQFETGKDADADLAIYNRVGDLYLKLNDPGASQYIVQTLAQDGWNGLLRFYEAEIWRLRNREADDDRAAAGYAAAVHYPDAPADAWRWHGIMLQKAGRRDEARTAFNRYLAMTPNAPDAPFIRQQLQQ